MSNDDELTVDPVTGLVTLEVFEDQLAVQEAIDADIEERGG